MPIDLDKYRKKNGNSGKKYGVLTLGDEKIPTPDSTADALYSETIRAENLKAYTQYQATTKDIVEIIDIEYRVPADKENEAVIDSSYTPTAISYTSNIDLDNLTLVVVGKIKNG